jgi:hypothetical protein
MHSEYIKGLSVTLTDEELMEIFANILQKKSAVF